eukprot:Skav204856  [mRNA]  locus=scaffold1883:169069:170282:- [translate_table: standard]
MLKFGAVLLAALCLSAALGRTCPYIYQIRLDATQREEKLTSKQMIVRKEVDDVLGGPKCGHDRAYFRQMQTRSADEPMTTFYSYRCTSCAHNWKED